MLKDFRAFIAKGNVLDLAVAVIIGAAFAKIVTSPEAASAGMKIAYSNLRTIHGAATAKASRAQPARQRWVTAEES